MQIKEEVWSGIPVLHIVEEQIQDECQPVVFFLHGFTSAKEHNLHYAFQLAKRGIRVILPEAHLHGVRSESIDEVELALRFWETVLTSIEELGGLYTYLMQQPYGQQVTVGIGGTSMGAITTFGALMKYDWAEVAVSMMGAPGYVELATAQLAQYREAGFTIPLSEEEIAQLMQTLTSLDGAQYSEKLLHYPIYFWHGQKDPVVPFAPTYRFYETNKEQAMDWKFTKNPTRGHAVPRPAMLEAVNWFASHLKDEQELAMISK